jgi:hypothetical protein
MEQIKLRNIEFRWSEEYQRYELIKWNGDPYYFTIALYDKTDRGYELRIVRPSLFFQDKDSWTVAKHSITFLKRDFDQNITAEEVDT